MRSSESVGIFQVYPGSLGPEYSYPREMLNRAAGTNPSPELESPWPGVQPIFDNALLHLARCLLMRILAGVAQLGMVRNRQLVERVDVMKPTLVRSIVT